MPNPSWDSPLRLLGGLHYLALAGDVSPWGEVVEFVAERREWLRTFIAEHSVQTNEVQRCWALLPAFLLLAHAAGSHLDLVELGPSAGLNLCWDRYRYRYRAGNWGPGDAGFELAGEELAPVPGMLLEQGVAVQRRLGIDLEPVDITSEHGVRLLECFVWADQPERLDRLRHAIDLVRRDPPRIIRADFVEALPEVLSQRSPERLTVVFQTASTAYVSRDRYDYLLESVRRAAADAPLGWISTRRPFEQETERHCYELELALWPSQDRRRFALMGFHGQWLEWVA